MIRSATIPIGSNPAVAALQADQTRRLNEQKQQQLNIQDQQNRQIQAQRDTQANVSADRAQSQTLANQMMADPNTAKRTDGNSYELSTPGAGGGGAGGGGVRGGGIAIGGGIYPDISGMLQQLQQPIQPPGRIAPPQVPSTSGAFAHAKDVSGRVGNKALEALRNGMTQRGISDSGWAAEGEANILGNIARQQSDAEYEAANIDNTRQWNANQMAYQGDLGQNELEYDGAIQQRNQGLALLQALMRQMY